MSNANYLFYICVIIVSAILSIGTIWYAIVTSPTLQARWHEKSLKALALELELTREQNTQPAK